MKTLLTIDFAYNYDYYKSNKKKESKWFHFCHETAHLCQVLQINSILDLRILPIKTINI